MIGGNNKSDKKTNNKIKAAMVEKPRSNSDA
jgi:hypothetical protein